MKKSVKFIVICVVLFVGTILGTHYDINHALQVRNTTLNKKNKILVSENDSLRVLCLQQANEIAAYKKGILPK